MSIQKEYKKLITQLAENKEWQKKDDVYRVGNAGVAITISFLHDRILELRHLKKQIPDFSQSEIRLALKKLKENGYFNKNKNKEYVLSIDKGTDLTDIIFWALLVNVVNGFLDRK